MAWFLIPLLSILCFHPLVSPSQALACGIFIALFFGNPYRSYTSLWMRRCLSCSVVGLGAGMNLLVLGRVGVENIGLTIVTLLFILGTGLFLGYIFGVPKKISFLIAIGTAICGGSAIAALAPLIRAKDDEISIALGVIFLLNASALLFFPYVGHHFHLTQEQFGFWSALAIHDTSSVVGAAAQYGDDALDYATVVKLSRALWILPISALVGLYGHVKSEMIAGEKSYKPWFILGFIMTSALFTWVPDIQFCQPFILNFAKKGLVLSLFLIGLSLTWDTLKTVGLRPLLQGVSLWAITLSTVLLVVLYR
jgi:uncharacterized integral membrane protein (TIGR00698 family)